MLPFYLSYLVSVTGRRMKTGPKGHNTQLSVAEKGELPGLKMARKAWVTLRNFLQTKQNKQVSKPSPFHHPLDKDTVQQYSHLCTQRNKLGQRDLKALWESLGG